MARVSKKIVYKVSLLYFDKNPDGVVLQRNLGVCPPGFRFATTCICINILQESIHFIANSPKIFYLVEQKVYKSGLLINSF